jgi:arylformamidase
MGTIFGETNWRSMSQEQRDLGLNNSAAVPGSAELVASWEQRSAATRDKHSAHLDLRYGPRDRNRTDFLKAAEGGPTLVLIHGGYWQMRSKETVTWFAEGPMAHGINVALIGYTLAPEATMDEIVAEIHRALDALVDQLPALGGDPTRIVVSGWSAGGHLATMALSHPRVKAGIAISGIFDLEPIRHSFGAELPMLRQQSADMAAHRAVNGLAVSYEEIPGADHFSVMLALGSPTGRITTLIRQLFERG